jgi:hypothetical protein
MSSKLKQRSLPLGATQKFEKFVSAATAPLRQELAIQKKAQVPQPSKLITNKPVRALSPKKQLPVNILETVEGLNNSV